MNYKRSLSKAAAILNIIINAFNTLIYAYLGYVMYIVAVIASNVDTQSNSKLILLPIILSTVATILISLLSVVIVVLSALTLKNNKLSTIEFNKRKGTHVATLVLTLISIALHLVNVFCSTSIFIGYVSLVILGLIAIFFIIDLSKNKKALKNPELFNEQNTVEQQPIEQTIEEKIAKLNNMKEQGLISEEQYNSLKQDLLK